MRPPTLGAHDDPAQLRAALVGIVADERPGMSYVKPGDTTRSYLVEKIKGRMIDRDCTDHDCGDVMPLDNPPLPVDVQQMIATWIDQGARDN